MPELNHTFPFSVKDQPMWPAQLPGLCGPPDLIQNPNALAPWAYHTGAFQFTIDSASTKDIISPATGNKVELFKAGLEETIPGTWFTGTEDLTNIPRGQEGAPVCKGQIFKVVGVMTKVLFPFAKFDSSSTAPTFEPAWLKDSPNGPAYGSRVQRSIIDFVSVMVKHNNPVIEFPLGPISHWTGYPGASGNTNTRNGDVAVIAFTPLPFPMVFGPEDSCRQLSVTLKYGQQHRIANDASQPTVATEGNILYAPVVVTLVGHICTDAAAVACLAPVAPQPVPPPNNAAGYPYRY